MDRKALPIILIVLAMLISFNLGYLLFPSPKALSFTAPAIGSLGKGSIIEFEMRITQGSGKTLVDIQNADFREDVENALRKARYNADRYLGISSRHFDISLSVQGDGNVVSGESAGGMFAVAIIALEIGKGLRDDVIISAVILENGNLEEVGGIEEKILAAKEGKRNVFLVSSGQKIKDEMEVTQGIRIIRVRNLGEAAKYLIA